MVRVRTVVGYRMSSVRFKVRKGRVNSRVSLNLSSTVFTQVVKSRLFYSNRLIVSPQSPSLDNKSCPFKRGPSALCLAGWPDALCRHGTERGNPDTGSLAQSPSIRSALVFA